MFFDGSRFNVGIVPVCVAKDKPKVTVAIVSENKEEEMSVRAQQVAEVMWELKQAEKLGTYTLIANRAGFTAGTNGRTMIGCMKKIRREWPHLEWWRAIEDSMLLAKNSEQVKELEKNGFEMEPAASDDKHVKPAELETHLVVWNVIDGVDETESAEEEAEETEEAVSK